MTTEPRRRDVEIHVDSRSGRAVQTVRSGWRGWLGVASLAFFGFTLLALARRSYDLDELALTEQRGVVAWLCLAVLASTTVAPGGQFEVSTSDRRTRIMAVWFPVVAAVFGAFAWSTGAASLRLAASLLLAMALTASVVPWLMSRMNAGALTVAELGSIIAFVMLATTLLMEAALAFADASSAVPAAVLDARAPGLSAVAVITGMSLVEAGLPGEPQMAAVDIAGTFQLLLFAVGWLVLVAGFGLDSISLAVTAVGLHLLAVTVFLVRLASRLVPREAVRPELRWVVAALAFGAAYVGLLMHVVVGVADGRYADGSLIPAWLEVAVDLVVFAGLTGNGLMWLVWRTASRDVDGRLVPATFVLYNAGVASAVIGAAAGVTVVSRVGWVSMSIASLLVASVVGWNVAFGPVQQHLRRLQSETRSR